MGVQSAPPAGPQLLTTATMGEDGIVPNLSEAGSTIAHELMEEDLQRELARNEMATRMAMEREVEAKQVKKRAEESQKQMQSMLGKYEDMKSKLAFTKDHLEETQVKITNQSKLTDKILAMKERVEAYAKKKEAVAALTEHVNIRQFLQQNQLEIVKESITEELVEGNTENTIRLQGVKVGLKEHTDRMESIKANIAKNEQTMEKREQLKVMLERQCDLEEKRTSEQNKIAQAREKLLELKMKELELQKARVERIRREQEDKKRATNDFLVQIETELVDMAEKAKAPLVAERDRMMGAIPKEGKNKGKGKKSNSNTPKVMSPAPKTPKVLSPEPEQEKGQVDAAMSKSERKEAILRRMDELDTEPAVKEEKMSEEEVRAMVEKGCKAVSGDMADMAMSEQYLRTKQAILMAKKKEEEMKVATNIATIREQEVQKMKDKVKAMQDLLTSRRNKLKLTEDILVEKSEEKKHIDKDMEKMKRRENYVEKELIDRVIFEKPAQKK